MYIKDFFYFGVLFVQVHTNFFLEFRLPAVVDVNFHRDLRKKMFEIRYISVFGFLHFRIQVHVGPCRSDLIVGWNGQQTCHFHRSGMDVVWNGQKHVIFTEVIRLLFLEKLTRDHFYRKETSVSDTE